MQRLHSNTVMMALEALYSHFLLLMISFFTSFSLPSSISLGLLLVCFVAEMYDGLLTL